MTNSADPDLLASSEANWSGSTLFAKTGHVVLSKRRVNIVLVAVIQLNDKMVHCQCTIKIQFFYKKNACSFYNYNEQVAVGYFHLFNEVLYYSFCVGTFLYRHIFLAAWWAVVNWQTLRHYPSKMIRTVHLDICLMKYLYDFTPNTVQVVDIFHLIESDH